MKLKNSFLKLSVGLIALMVFSSCKKEEITPEESREEDFLIINGSHIDSKSITSREVIRFPGSVRLLVRFSNGGKFVAFHQEGTLNSNILRPSHVFSDTTVSLEYRPEPNSLPYRSRTTENLRGMYTVFKNGDHLVSEFKNVFMKNTLDHTDTLDLTGRITWRTDQ